MDFAIQSGELLAEINRAEHVIDEFEWGRHTATESEVRRELDDLRDVAVKVAAVPDDESEQSERLWLSNYSLMTELRDWRGNLEMVLARIPALRRKR